MTDCGCEKAKAELEEYLHREVSESDFADITEHLEACTDCSEEHLVGLVLTEKVRTACQETAPADLRAAVIVRLEQLQG
jgi:anti-sigma factor (TIGR02949 family)